MGIKIDWDAEESGSGFAPVPEGTWPATCIDLKISEKPGPSGYHWIKLVFGKIQAPDVGENKQAWTDIMSLSPAGLWKLHGVLDNLGIDRDAAGDTDDLREAVVGMNANIVVEHKPHWEDAKAEQGVVVDEVTDVLAGDGFGV